MRTKMPSALRVMRQRISNGIYDSEHSRYNTGPYSRSASALYSIRPDLFSSSESDTAWAGRLRRHGLSRQDVERRVAQQAGVCKVCGRIPSGKSRGNGKLQVDHDHKTGRVRDLLCSNCNTALGLAHDDPQILRRLADYLESWAD